jgi:hypothetical protein
MGKSAYMRILDPFFEHLPIKEDLSKISQNYS